MVPYYVSCDRKIAANTGCEACRAVQCSAEAPAGPLLPSGGELATKQILSQKTNNMLSHNTALVLHLIHQEAKPIRHDKVQHFKERCSRRRY